MIVSLKFYLFIVLFYFLLINTKYFTTFFVDLFSLFFLFIGNSNVIFISMTLISLSASYNDNPMHLFVRSKSDIKHNNSKLNPWYVTGFSDGDSSFWFSTVFYLIKN